MRSDYVRCRASIASDPHLYHSERYVRLLWKRQPSPDPPRLDLAFPSLDLCGVTALSDGNGRLETGSMYHVIVLIHACILRLQLAGMSTWTLRL